VSKLPGVAETLDWARALMVLNADELETELVNDTLNVILKHQGDIAKAQSELNALEAKAQHVTVPLSYADELYSLRSHIELVRERLSSAKEAQP